MDVAKKLIECVSNVTKDTYPTKKREKELPLNLENIIDFKGIFELSNKGKVYCGALKETMTRKHILELPIIAYNDRLYRIMGVEAPCIPCPLRAGLNVGLLMVEV